MSTFTTQINPFFGLQILKDTIEREKGYKIIQLFGNDTNRKKIYRKIKYIENFVKGDLRGGVNNTFPRYKTGMAIGYGNRTNIE